MSQVKENNENVIQQPEIENDEIQEHVFTYIAKLKLRKRPSDVKPRISRVEFELFCLAVFEDMKESFIKEANLELYELDWDNEEDKSSSSDSDSSYDLDIEGFNQLDLNVQAENERNNRNV
ncbi:MAG: hypothetical protein ACOYB2_19800 [Limnohabitans sp.]